MDPLSVGVMTFLHVIDTMHPHISLRKFRSMYGVHFCTAAILWLVAASIDTSLTPLYIFWFFYWARTYCVEEVGADHWKYDLKTYRKYVYKVLIALFVGLDSVSFVLLFIVNELL